MQQQSPQPGFTSSLEPGPLTSWTSDAGSPASPADGADTAGSLFKATAPAQDPGREADPDSGQTRVPGSDREQPLAHRSFMARRRNRHDRGLRGEIMLPAMPGSLTRSEAFDQMVVESTQRLAELWGPELEKVEFLVEEIPDALEELVSTGERVPLGRYRAATAGSIAGITIYRHPVRNLVDTPAQLRELVHEVMIEQVAGLLGIDPDAVDPLYRHFRWR